MQSNWNFQKFLMGMQNSMAMPLFENSLVVSYNIKHTFTDEPTILLLGIYTTDINL